MTTWSIRSPPRTPIRAMYPSPMSGAQARRFIVREAGPTREGAPATKAWLRSPPASSDHHQPDGHAQPERRTALRSAASAVHPDHANREPRSMSGARALLVTGCFLFAPAAVGAVERCPGGLATRIVPLPVYATLPNEGDTFGAMPVFLRVCDANARTESIIAPSITWNDVIHWTGTFRLFHYPSDEQSLTFIASASTRINSGVLLQWRDPPPPPRALTTEKEARRQRSPLFPFFRLRPHPPASHERRHTRVRGRAFPPHRPNHRADRRAELVP